MPNEGLSNLPLPQTIASNRNFSSETELFIGQVRVNSEALAQAGTRNSSTVENTASDSTIVKQAITAGSDQRDWKDLGVVRLPNIRRQVPREIKLQEWEGQVQVVGPHHFVARLVDLTANETEETEEVDLPLSDVTESDQPLLVPGAVFRWIVGYRYTDGVKERFTRVVVRRLPVWTEREIRSADDEAIELYNALIGNADTGAASAGSG